MGPSAFLALLWLLPPPRLSRRRRAAQEKISGDQVSISPQLRWTLLALRDPLWGQNLPRLSRLVLMSLKPEVLAELDESAMATCAQERVAMIGKMMEKKHKRCANKFSEEDKAELTEMALKIQGYNCFKEMFHSACQKSVKSQVYAFFQAQAMAAASTEASTTGAPATTTA